MHQIDVKLPIGIGTGGAGQRSGGSEPRVEARIVKVREVLRRVAVEKDILEFERVRIVGDPAGQCEIKRLIGVADALKELRVGYPNHGNAYADGIEVRGDSI